MGWPEVVEKWPEITRFVACGVVVLPAVVAFFW